MKKHSFLAVLISFISFIILAGCAGGNSALGDPFVESPGPSGGSNPFFVPGGDAPDEETPGGPTTPPASSPGDVPPASGTGTAPPIECFAKVLPEGAVSNEYSQVLEASGGSGELTYALTAGTLPDGLDLATDGMISGMPAEAAKRTPKVQVKDANGKKKTCSLEITIRGDLELTAVPLEGAGIEGSWNAVYHVTASDDVDDISWAWTGDTENVCASVTPPNLATDFRTNCTLASLSGSVAYVWLKADSQGAEPKVITLTVTSPYAQSPASHDFDFTYTPEPDCGNGLVEEGEQCDGSVESGFTCNAKCLKEKIPADATSVKVTLWTGDAGDDSDTDCDAYITFCTDAPMTTCTSEQELNDTADDDDRENGNENIYDAADGLSPNGMTEAHRYFKLRLGSDCGNDSNSWLLQGIKVEITYADSAPNYTYFNPCVEKWMDDGDTIPFGPNDTAVCAIIVTGGVDDADTDDEVYLVLKNFDNDEVSRGRVTTRISSWSSHFTTVTSNTSDLAALQMYWGGADDGNDFEKNDDASYGDYVFDIKPFSDAPMFYIKKGGDPEDDDRWFPHSANVYVFRPGKILNAPVDGDGPTVYHGEFVYDQWLDYKNGFATATWSLPEGDPRAIQIGIGQVWED